jgi:uncharacterized paraquat-inducible protein A
MGKPEPTTQISLALLASSSYWFCLECEHVCNAIQSDQGQPSKCDRCGSHRVELQEAGITP